MITDPGWTYIVTALCQSFVPFCARAVSSRERSLKPAPPSPPEMMICVNWAFADCFCGNLGWRWRSTKKRWSYNTSKGFPQKSHILRLASGTFNPAHWSWRSDVNQSSQVSVKVSISQSVQSSVRQVMISVRCQSVRPWCIFHCEWIKVHLQIPAWRRTFPCAEWNVNITITTTTSLYREMRQTRRRAKSRCSEIILWTAAPLQRYRPRCAIVPAALSPLQRFRSCSAIVPAATICSIIWTICW